MLSREECKTQCIECEQVFHESCIGSQDIHEVCGHRVEYYSDSEDSDRQSEEDYVPEGENDPEGRYVSSDDDHSGIVRINNRSRSIVKESKLL